MKVTRLDGDMLDRARNTASPEVQDRTTRAVILAGGRGTRLAPYTSVLPKPLMPIGDVSILELVLEQLESCGVKDITLSVGYLSHLIRAVLGANRRAQRIEYVQEGEPLGTAGPLRLITRPGETFLVMNGDVLTTMRFGDLLDHHRRSGSALTIATHQRTIKIDYGVLDLEAAPGGPLIRAFHEKPEISSSVSMGIYAMEPEVLELIPADGVFDVPDLVNLLLEEGLQVGAYPFSGMWFDIGRAEDYEQAVTAWFAHVAAEEDSAEAAEEPESPFVPRQVASG